MRPTYRCPHVIALALVTLGISTAWLGPAAQAQGPQAAPPVAGGQYVQVSYASSIPAAVTPRAAPVLAELGAALGTGGLPIEVKTETAAVSLREICRGGRGSPRVVVTARRMPPHLADSCATLERGQLVALELGREPLILATRAESPLRSLTPRQVYLALARDVPAGDEFRRNVSVRWSEVDPSLPPVDVRFQLPTSEDSRRAMFDALILEGGCRSDPMVKGIYEADQRVARCVTVRFDRVREVAREHAVRALLDAPPGTVGVVSARELASTDGKLVPLELDGREPSESAIQSGSYGFAAQLWLFLRIDRGRAADTPLNRELRRLADLATSDEFAGRLTSLGFLPLAEEERVAQRAAMAGRAQSRGMAWVTSLGASLVRGTQDFLVRDGRRTQTPSSTDRADLARLMEIAGYKLAELETSVGIVPGAGMTFKISREMSDSDREFLERELLRDARARTSLQAALQRRLVHAILAVGDTDGFQVSKAEVTLLPLPSVKLLVTPRGGGGSDSTVVLRAIERLEDELLRSLR